MSVDRLKVLFYDARGVLIEEFEASLEEAQDRIADFVELHGTDPEEDGKDAMSGTIEFIPLF